MALFVKKSTPVEEPTPVEDKGTPAQPTMAGILEQRKAKRDYLGSRLGGCQWLARERGVPGG